MEAIVNEVEYTHPPFQRENMAKPITTENMVKPITPDQLVTAPIPDAVISVFNTLISRNWNGHQSIVKQDDVINLLGGHQISALEAFSRRYLDVEDIYREAGWEVEYDKAGYNESYPATFTFSKVDKASR